jgi:hypothetical protein
MHVMTWMIRATACAALAALLALSGLTTMVMADDQADSNRRSLGPSIRLRPDYADQSVKLTADG